jgi:hypothetical protein
MSRLRGTSETKRAGHKKPKQMAAFRGSCPGMSRRMSRFDRDNTPGQSMSRFLARFEPLLERAASEIRGGSGSTPRNGWRQQND